MWRRLFGGILRSQRDTGQARPAPTASLPRRRDWATLPPLNARGHQSFGLASGIDQFSRALVQRHRAVRHLEPLGHEVARHAPQGVVTGLVRAVEVVPEHGPVLDQPLRRRPKRQGRGSWRSMFRWTSPEPAASPPPPGGPPSGRPAPPPVSRSTAPDPSPPTEDVGTEPAVWSPPPAEVPVGPPDAPDQGPAPRPDGSGVTAGREQQATPSRPVVGQGPRILRSVAPSRSSRAPLSQAQRPPDLPLRPLAAQRVATTDRAADDHESELPPTPLETPSEAHDEPADGTPDTSDRGEAARVEVSGPDRPPAPEVRPTIGAPGTPPPAGTPAPSRVPSTTSADVTSDSPTRPGVGSPLGSLPPTAQRVHSSTDPAVPRTAQGRDVAVQRGLQRWSHVASQTSADPAARLADGPPGPAPARPRPDLPLPPVVARRLEGTVPPAEPKLDAPSAPVRPRPEGTVSPTEPKLDASDRDESPAPVLPLVSLRQPLSGPAPTPAEVDDVGQVDGWWKSDGAPGPAGPGSPTRPGSRRGPAGSADSSSRRIGGPLHRDAETSVSSSVVPVRWRAPAEVEPRDPAPGVSRSRWARSRGAEQILAHEGVGQASPRRVNGPPSDQPVPTRVSRGSHPARPVLRSLSRPTEGSSGSVRGRGLADLPSDALDVPLVQDFLASRGIGPGGSSGTSTKPRMPLAAQVQRERDERPRDTTSPQTESSPVQRREAPAAPTADRPEVEPGGGDVDREELFRELYPRVRDELRWELRVQRERAGLLADPL